MSIYTHEKFYLGAASSELPQWGPGQSPGRQYIFGIFEAHRTAHKKLSFS